MFVAADPDGNRQQAEPDQAQQCDLLRPELVGAVQDKAQEDLQERSRR